MLKKKRRKGRIVLIIKKHNDNTVLGSCYIPYEIVLFNIIQQASWVSKINYKSGYLQIKIDDKSIPLTISSAP